MPNLKIIMTKKFKKIWYASYGSNMLENRFMCYIRGGRPEGALRTYTGCSNKAQPEKNKPVEIPAELYFARNSKTWHGGGIAFINPDGDKGNKTLGRMYLIEPDQFTDLVKQESRYEGELTINFEKAVREGQLIIDIRSWYGKLVFLGFDDNHPVFTFTNEAFLQKEFNMPHQTYLNMISRGLQETYDLSKLQIKNYFQSKKGFQEVGEER